MKVSIIIPCYNGAVFLKNAIESVQKQTYTDIEIIVVNDCSTDNSLTIMRRMAESDHRIVVIDKKVNEGVDYARFSGIKVATGDYFAFLDADDWLTNDAVRIWIDIVRKTNVDIVYANNVRVYSQLLGIKRTTSLDRAFTEKVLNGQEKDNLFISFFGVNLIPVTIWGNLYKKDLFNSSLRESGLKFGEDLALGMQLYYAANSIYMTNKVVVYYRWGGVTAKYQSNFINSVKKLFEYKMEFVNAHNLEREKRTAVIELANCLATQALQMAEYFPNRTQENLKELEAEFKDPVYTCFEEYKSDPYFQKGNLNTACVNLDYKVVHNIAKKISSTPKNKLRHWIKIISSKLLTIVKL